jgi:hypothetical protein
MKIVETSLTARGVMEEILVPVTCEDKTEPFVTDESFDRAVHGRHSGLLEINVRSERALPGRYAFWIHAQEAETGRVA